MVDKRQELDGLELDIIHPDHLRRCYDIPEKYQTLKTIPRKIYEGCKTKFFYEGWKIWEVVGIYPEGFVIMVKENA